MTVALAIMARAPVDTVLTAIRSAKDFVDRCVVVVSPATPDEWKDELIDRAPNSLRTSVVCQGWLGYADTRTAVYRSAGEDPDVDWVLMLDAHAIFTGELPDLAGTPADVHAYAIPVDHRFPGGRWRWIRRGHLQRARLPYEWKGTAAGMHEILIVPPEHVRRWDGLVFNSVTGEAKDWGAVAEKAEAAIPDENGDPRSAFYRAYALRDAGRQRDAYDAFLARAAMESTNVEETFWAHLWAAKIARWLPIEHDEIVSRGLAAHHFAPKRAEPMRELAEAFMKVGDAPNAARWANAARECSYPRDAEFFVDVGAYSEEALIAAGIGIDTVTETFVNRPPVVDPSDVPPPPSTEPELPAPSSGA
jgi:hypothetical protein